MKIDEVIKVLGKEIAHNKCVFNERADVIEALTTAIETLKRIEPDGISVKLIEASSFTHTPPNYDPIKLCFLPTPEIRAVVAQAIVNYLQGEKE